MRKNDIEVTGDVVSIYMTSRTGEISVGYADVEDLPLIQSRTWYVMYNGKIKYVSSNYSRKLDGKRGAVYLHRLVANAPLGLVVDHKNHDTLDNRKSNLRVCTQGENMQNRASAQTNNRCSIVSGVWWSAEKKKYRVGIRVHGKPKHIGYFSDKLEAEAASIEAKAMHHPFSKERAETDK